MLDNERILSKLDELESYVTELKSIMPKNYEEYIEEVEKKRSCERLLHIAIECVIDVCILIVKGLKLGLPSAEGDVFEKLGRKRIITHKMKNKLKEMKGFRNILVHRYSEVDDELVFEKLKNIGDFREFKGQILKLIRKRKKGS